MKETDDDRITANIRQVFEDFEDLSAEHGWQELRKKFPEPARKPLLLWMSAAALLLVASGLWFFNYTTPDEIIANKNQPAAEVKTARKSIIQDDSAVIKNHTERSAASKQENSDPSSGNRPTSEARTSSISAALTEENKIEADNEPVPSVKDLITQIPDLGLNNSSAGVKLEQNDRDSAISALAEMSLFTPSNSLKAGNIFPVENQPMSKRKANDRSLSLSFYAGSFFNYAEGSESNLNFGAGFSSDIRLSKNVKLSTGLNLTNNKLDFNQNIPGNADRSFQASLSVGNSGQAMLSNYKAELLSLDIPVNIKYTPNPDKNDLYILAGLSSGTYLQETYGAQFQTFSNSGSFINQAQTRDENISKQLEHFDLAKTLNVSFGFSTKLTKEQRITIEPFLKYPLGGLGTQNIKFGSSGINIKLKINSSKK